MKKELKRFKQWAIKNGYQQNETSILWYFNRKGKARKIDHKENKPCGYEVFIGRKWVDLNTLINNEREGKNENKRSFKETKKIKPRSKLQA